MSETVTAVPEIFSVAIHLSYQPNQKVHVVAELYRHSGDRRFLLDTQVYKNSANKKDVPLWLAGCLSASVGALTAPTKGRDLSVDPDSYQGSQIGVVDFVWQASHGGRNSVKLSADFWVTLV
jgi:hypothetical protein